MFKGMGQLGDMAKMMKAAKDMQERVGEMQARLDAAEVTGEAGAGMVKARASMKGELRGLDIDPSLFRAEDKEVVEDLIVAAVADAQAKGKAEMEAEMAKIGEELGLPAGMKMPF